MMKILQMCGKGEVFEANDEELMRINKLLTDFGFSPMSSKTMHLYHTAIILDKNILHERIKGLQGKTATLSREI